MKPNLKWWISLTIVACVMLTAGWASAQQAQGLLRVGAPDPANGYPKWHMDRNGLQLGQCLVTPADDPCALAGTFPNPAAPIVFPTNFPDEFFYMRATARIDGIGGGIGRADLGYALEGAFGGATVTAADGAGAQIVFARFRIQVTAGLVPGATYTMTAPYGTQSFVATATGTINFTSDQGCAAAPCNFASLLTNTNVGPFVRWDATSAPPAGFIGQPAVDHGITGSPFGNNFFRLTGPNVGGPGVNTVQTNLFSITGRLFVRPATTTSLTSTPNPSTVGQAVTLRATVSPVAPATGVPDGTVTFRDGAATLATATLVNGSASFVTSALATGSHSLTAVYSGSLDFSASTSAAVTQVVNAAAPAPPPAGATDTVTINRAELAVAKGELRVEGTTTRLANGSFAASVEIHNGPAVGGACTGALIATTPVNAGSWAFRGITTLRPTTVCVKSAGGGVASRAVAQK